MKCDIFPLELTLSVGLAVGLSVGGAIEGRFVMVLYCERHVRIIEVVTDIVKSELLLLTYPQRPQESGQLFITSSTIFSLPPRISKIGPHRGH